FLCKKSGIKVIAEYVHNKEVQEKVKALGIDYSQGYYFSEPKPDISS
ncbi:MAG: EAL domain-containing protein, partial [Sulfurimonas sp.]|nr:EAL domain-containing protein [Sulfurimonas sp.]